MNLLRKARHLAVVGKSGTGKTTLALRYLLNSHHQRIVIADHEGEFAHRLRVPLNLDWGSFYSALETQRVICVDITELDPEGAEAAFDQLAESLLDLCKTVFEPKGLETLLVMDEVQKYTSPHTMPLNFKNCMETGRKWNLDTLSISQRPNAINGAMKEQFTEMFFFRLKDENSHKFGAYFGLSPEEQDGLADGEYIYMNMQDGTTRKDRLWEEKKLDTV